MRNNKSRLDWIVLSRFESRSLLESDLIYTGLNQFEPVSPWTSMNWLGPVSVSHFVLSQLGKVWTSSDQSVLASMNGAAWAGVDESESVGIVVTLKIKWISTFFISKSFVLRVNPGDCLCCWHWKLPKKLWALQLVLRSFWPLWPSLESCLDQAGRVSLLVFTKCGRVQLVWTHFETKQHTERSASLLFECDNGEKRILGYS